MTSSLLFQNDFILIRLFVAKFTGIIKIATMFIKTTCKDSSKVKRIEIIY